MIYKPYGTTGKNVSAIGFGGMRFDTNRPDEENAQLLHYALDKGINYFDTAPDYCKDKSEDIFGIAIDALSKAGRRQDFFVTTKGMPEDFPTADKARAAVETSLKRLKSGCIDFYHVWCIRNLSQYELAMRPGGQYEGLQRCKDEGLIKHIVISTHLRGDDVRKILAKKEFDGVLLGVNILNFLYRWEGVLAAHEQGLGVVAMNPLAGGIIPRHEKSLSFLAAPGQTPTEAALGFLVSCPQITVTLVGFTAKEHIDTACRVVDTARPFTAADIDRIKRHVTQNMDKLCTGCGYCLDKCPRDIPIDSYMQYYNETLLAQKSEKEMIAGLDFQHNWGLLAHTRTRSEDCVRCGRCELACTQHLDIISRLERLVDWEAQKKKA
ncbi:MAG: aldo/keto reductase [Planctomycetaceae bacterium]|nr:aldo/keto reductase [Planctomycetaceae bacterium]